MYAIVEITGKQFKVSPEQTVNVPYMNKKPGDKVKFDRVLLMSDDAGTTIGAPHISGFSVQGTVLDNGKEDKVIVFKKKKRKGYRVKRGHRQNHTVVQINKIGK